MVNALDRVEDLWVSFFMPAFFFLTGYCTDFKKRFMPFLVQGIKILILPAVVINYGSTIVEYISWGESALWIVKTTVKSFLLTCAGEWFIPSLFLARLAVWKLVRLKRVESMLVISFVMLCAGVVLYDCFPWIPEIWSYKHALMVTIFMVVGDVLKKKQNTHSVRRPAKLYPIVSGGVYLRVGNPVYHQSCMRGAVADSCCPCVGPKRNTLPVVCQQDNQQQ